MKKFAFLSAVLLLSACAPAILIPIQSDVDRAAPQFPGLTLADLSEGKTLFETHCGTCHDLPKLKSRDAAGWKQIVPPMAGKVNKKAGKDLIDAQGQEKILRYVITMSGAPKKR